MIRKSHRPKLSNAQNLAREIISSQSYMVMHKAVIARYGIVPSAILANLVEKQKYFENQHPENEGWFFQSHRDQMASTGASEYAIKDSKKRLIMDGVLRIKRVGVPAKEWYYIDYEALSRVLCLMDPVIDTTLPDCEESHTLDCVKTHTLDCVKTHSLKDNNLEDKELENKYISRERAKIVDKNREAFIAIAYQLSETIRSRKSINHTTSQILGWVPSIRALARITLKDSEEPPIRRIKRALKWYRDHMGEPYVPVIESGKSLREKFLRLEDAVARDKDIGSKRVKSPSNKYKNIKKITLGGD